MASPDPIGFEIVAIDREDLVPDRRATEQAAARRSDIEALHSRRVEIVRDIRATLNHVKAHGHGIPVIAMSGM